MTVATDLPAPLLSDASDDLIAARKAIAELLSVLKVNTVISVDDQYAVTIQRETVIRRLKHCDPGALETLATSTQQLADLIENGALMPIEDAATLVDELWEDLGPEIHQALSAIANKDHTYVDTSPEDETDLASTATITTLFDESVGVELLSLANWTERAASFAAPDHGGVLVLFDRDFTKENGGETEGDRLATELAARNLEGVHCGLLTHSVTSFEQELAVARKLPDWPATSLIVLNKGRLNNPGHFA
ncbi:hypothetical protein, partial [Streptomyces sp. NPDC002082]|uniref:hypothetical protein n=1 Tax=Streptomyces sp. NPDC002082 TaxID=3154772 RepID=UPI00331B4980